MYCVKKVTKVAHDGFDKLEQAAQPELDKLVAQGKAILEQLTMDDRDNIATDEQYLQIAEKIKDQIQQAKVNMMRINDRRRLTVEAIGRNAKQLAKIVERVNGDIKDQKLDQYCESFTASLIASIHSAIGPNTVLVPSNPEVTMEYLFAEAR